MPYSWSIYLLEEANSSAVSLKGFFFAFSVKSTPQVFITRATIIAICSRVSVLFGSKIPGSVPPIMPSSYAAVTSASSQSVKGVLPAAFHSFPVITFRKRITILQKSFLVMGDFAFCKSASVRSPC